MTARYYSHLPVESDQVTLAGTEAHHLIHVMRAKPGAEVVLFDGSGKEFAARLEQVSRKTATLQILSTNEINRERPLSITLAVALPKGDRQRWLVEKVVELGVQRLVPIRTERSVAQPKEKVLDRLRKTVIEASKQSGRNRLMEITDPIDWSAMTEWPRDHDIAWMAHPDPTSKTNSGTATTAESSLLAIGPEGGWTDDEVALGTDAGWQIIDLGPRILRVETAAIFLVTMQ